MGNVWQARYITPNGRRRLIGSYSHGSMANALPQAVGAQLAYPGRQVLPPTIAGAQVKGFTLALSKMVMNGGAGEAVALARTNIKHALR